LAEGKRLLSKAGMEVEYSVMIHILSRVLDLLAALLLIYL
jgi:hypothetical protein